MGNTFLGLFRFTAPRPGRRKASNFFASAIDDAEIDVGKANDPVAILGLGDPDWLTHQHFADKDEVSAPADLAAPAYTANAMVGIIPWVFDPGRIGPRRSVVSARRCDLAERLVWPLLIVMFAEAIEAELLLRLALSRGARGLILERS